MRPFHLAFPVTDLRATERFYQEILQCKVGRRTPHSINFNFFGHQIVAHLVTTMPNFTDNGKIDGRQVPPFHFGLVMEWYSWHTLKDHLNQLNYPFRIKPHIRYPGRIGEQATMFIDDPSGNALEFKSFSDDSRLFATLEGQETAIGGGEITEPNAQ